MIPGGAARRLYYTGQYAAMTVHQWARDEAQEKARFITAHKDVYAPIARYFGILWQVPGILHCLESDCDMGTHLANGDSLDADTHHVPAGIMARLYPELKPPYRFEDAAIAALEDYREGWGLPALVISTNAAAMQFFDQWNGLGEWKITDKPGIPYLFSGTDRYINGKFTSDKKWDPDAVSKQVGAAAIMKALGM